MNVRYRITLTQYERNELLALLSGGKHPTRKLKRAQILLAADAGVSDEDIVTSIGVGGSTVYRTKRRFVEGNLEGGRGAGPRRLDTGAAGGHAGQAHCTRQPLARDGAPTPGRERSQALAQGHVVHSA